MTNENTTEAFAERLKLDEDMANTLYSYFGEWGTNGKTLYEHIAHFAKEKGFVVDVDALKVSLDGILPDDIVSGMKSARVRKPVRAQVPAGALSDVVNPKDIGEDIKGAVFSQMYGRVGRKYKRD